MDEESKVAYTTSLENKNTAEGNIFEMASPEITRNSIKNVNTTPKKSKSRKIDTNLK